MCTRTSPLKYFGGKRRVKVERDIPTAIEEIHRNSFYKVKAIIDLCGHDFTYIEMFGKKLSRRFRMGRDHRDPFMEYYFIDMEVKLDKLDILKREYSGLIIESKERIKK